MKNGSVVTETFSLELFEELTHGLLIRELNESESTTAHRYAVIDGTIVDLHPGLTDEQVNQLIQDASNANGIEFQMTPTDFLRFFGAMRRIAIRGLAKGGDPVAEDLLNMFNRVPYISSTDMDLKNGLMYFESLPIEIFGAANPFAGITNEFITTGKSFVS